jgi:hypothetical protein
MGTREVFRGGAVAALAVVLLSHPAASAVLPNVELGGWFEQEPGNGKWDDQNVNNPGPFPNIVAGLAGAGLPADGLMKIVKIDDPASSGGGAGVNFTITGNGGKSGTWTLNQGHLNLAGGKTLAYFSLKAALNWNLWQVMPDIDTNLATYTNAWDSNASGGGLLTPNNKNFADLSHIAFWAVDFRVIPEPSTSMLVATSVACWSATLAMRRGMRQKKA